MGARKSIKFTKEAEKEFCFQQNCPKPHDALCPPNCPLWQGIEASLERLKAAGYLREYSVSENGEIYVEINAAALPPDFHFWA